MMVLQYNQSHFTFSNGIWVSIGGKYKMKRELVQQNRGFLFQIDNLVPMEKKIIKYKKGSSLNLLAIKSSV